MDDLAEQVEALQNTLVAVATGGLANVREYKRLRSLVVEHVSLREIAPKFLRTCRDPDQFWQFIKSKYGTYAERRQFIWEAFRPVLERVESGGFTPADQSVSDRLKAFSAEGVHQVWGKAMERRGNDPEGAITSARTLLESVCKHILDQRGVPYQHDADLPTIYKATSKSLNIAPSQHSEAIFKQILGGCTAVVEGLGALRNRLSDAHGTGKLAAKPSARHAELAVNLAGAVAQFLVATDEHNREKVTEQNGGELTTYEEQHG